jgi:carboxyl-terminal processing protease
LEETTLTRRRGGSLAFVAALALATGAAFAAGSHLRTRFPRYAFDHPTQIAQAGGGGGGGGAQASGANGVLRIGDDPTSAGGAADDDVGLGPLQTFQTVYSLVKKNYVDPLPDDRKLSHGAVRAMLASLNDPNCQFFEPAERAALDGEARGRYAGIGAALAVVPHKRDGYTEHKITVVTPLPGSPAEKVGLRTGDVILSVDGKWVLGSDPFLAANKLVKKFQARDAEEEDVTKAFEAATARLKGGIGLGAAQKKLTAGQNETRTLTLQRAGVKDPIRVAITTAVTEVAPVEARKLAGGDVGYIKISAFTEGSGARFREALGGLPKPQQGLVLDLRGNPGGLLAPAREIAGLLTKGGKIGVEVGPNGKRSAVTVPPPRTAPCGR